MKTVKYLKENRIMNPSKKSTMYKQNFPVYLTENIDVIGYRNIWHYVFTHVHISCYTL